MNSMKITDKPFHNGVSTNFLMKRHNMYLHAVHKKPVPWCKNMIHGSITLHTCGHMLRPPPQKKKKKK